MEQIPLFQESGKKPPGGGRASVFKYRGMLFALIRKPRQKFLRLSAEQDGGARLSCPVKASQKEIERFIDSHWLWLQSQMAEREKLKKKHPPKKFREGEAFLFQGRPLKLKFEQISLLENAAARLCPRRRGHKTAFFKEGLFPAGFCAKGSQLIYYWRWPEDLRKEAMRANLRAFYKKEGSWRLLEALEAFSKKTGLSPKSVRVGAQKSLWGSCSKEGNISLNWRLMAAPPAVLEYVALHELAHLRHLDHSPEFWDFVGRFCPGYKKREAWLKKEARALDFLL